MASQPEATEASKSESKLPISNEDELEEAGDVPDPDEDDLDDLDDMLDDFKDVKIDPQKASVSGAAAEPPPASATTSETKTQSVPPVPGPAKGAGEKGGEDVLSDDEFAKQLQAGMAELMGELESSPEVVAQFESIFKELGAAAAAGSEAPFTTPGGAAAAPTTSASTAPGGADFQDTIRRTMERMQASGESATAAATAEGSEDFMAEMLRQMGGEGGMEGSEEELSKMLMGMMEQLTNKDILYEPMKELNDKFPEWMEKNGETVSAEDRERYDVQQALVKEIVAKFEESGYTDSNAVDRQYIVERMQKMQAAGSPPPDLVGDMPSAQDALGAPDMDSCNPQ